MKGCEASILYWHFMYVVWLFLLLSCSLALLSSLLPSTLSFFTDSFFHIMSVVNKSIMFLDDDIDNAINAMKDFGLDLQWETGCSIVICN